MELKYSSGIRTIRQQFLDSTACTVGLVLVFRHDKDVIWFQKRFPSPHNYGPLDFYNMSNFPSARNSAGSLDSLAALRPRQPIQARRPTSVTQRTSLQQTPDSQLKTASAGRVSTAGGISSAVASVVNAPMPMTSPDIGQLQKRQGSATGSTIPDHFGGGRVPSTRWFHCTPDSRNSYRSNTR